MILEKGGLPAIESRQEPTPCAPSSSANDAEVARIGIETTFYGSLDYSAN
jgi:hypothetical protein